MKRITCALLGFMLLVASPVAAQGDSLGLNASDALLLAAANATPLDSFAFDYTAHLTVDGLDTFAINVTLSGSGALDRAAPALDVSAQGTIHLGTTQFLSVDGALRWVNDTLYLNPGDGWQARENASVYAADLIYQYAALTADPDALAQWDAAAVDGVGAIVAALQSADPAAFLSAQRLDDESVSDVFAAHFQITADLHALMQTDAFVEAVAAFASAQGNDLIAVDRAELGDIVRANSALFETSTLTVDQYVGLDDSLPHRITFSLNMPLDPAVLGYDDPPLMVTATFDLTLNVINQIQDITAPDDAQAVAAFSMPSPAQETPGVGGQQYVYFETISEGEPYERSFDGLAGDAVTITARGLGLDFDTYVQLIAPGGEMLVENDDYENAPFGMGYYDSQIRQYALPESGAYTIRVEELSGGAGSFALTITVER